MEYTLLTRIHEIEVNWNKYKFKSPFIYDFLEFTEVLDMWEVKLYPNAIKTIVDIKEDLIYIIKNYVDIINKITKEIYPEDSRSWWWEWGNSNVFFPANIDYIASSYWMHPVDFLKKTRINQMEAISAAKEWNWNIKNWDEHKNKSILTRQLGKQFEEDAKARIRLKFNAKNKW